MKYLTNVTRLLCVSILLGLGLCSLVNRGSGEEASPSFTVMLHTVGGGFVSGELQPCEAQNVIALKSAAFLDPLAFPVEHVVAVVFESPPQMVQASSPGSPGPVVPSGDYCFELGAGDVLFGTLIDLSPESFEVENPHLGRIKLPRANLWRMCRREGGAGLVYFGPNGLSEWTQSPLDGWSEELGQLESAQPGATLYRDLGIPARACIELEISWSKKPKFEFAIGVDGSASSNKRAFRIEAWPTDIVVIRELETFADVTSLQAVEAGAGRLRVQLLLDQKQGKLHAFTPDGGPLAEITLTNDEETPLGGIHIENKEGDMRLERLRISQWPDGAEPQASRRGLRQIRRTDGVELDGAITRYDAATKQFLVTQESKEIQLAERDLDHALFGPRVQANDCAICAVLGDGSQVSGNLVRIDAARAYLSIPGVETPVPIPLAAIHSLTSLHAVSPLAESVAASGVAAPGLAARGLAAFGGSTGRLELDGIRLSGSLVEGIDGSAAGSMWWHAQESVEASAARIDPAQAGKIVYREAPKKDPAPAAAPSSDPQLRRIRVFRQRGAESIPPEDENATYGEDVLEKFLELRSGEKFPCEVASIDERGLTFRTPFSDATFVANEQIHSVNLSDSVSSMKIDKRKRERLLTLPRMQKENQPTHLLHSRNGDFLRGRLLELNDTRCVMEVRLERVEIPRDRIATITWLRSEESEATASQPPAAADPGGSPEPRARVFAHRNDGACLAVQFERVRGTTLIGRNDVLGACRINLDEVDQLVLGKAGDEILLDPGSRRWNVHPAREPTTTAGNAVEGNAGEGDAGQASGGGAAGAKSPLVGRPAPDFELKLNAGGSFKLSKRGARIVVLDFWASWCGPCVRALPQIDAAVAEFAGRGVELIAVNMQEDADRIASVVSRLKLKASIALDEDGSVARSYQVRSIPQTVVIGPDGKVVSVTVGGGPNSGRELRETIQRLLDIKE